MRQILIAILVICCTLPCMAADVYISPSGTDNGNCENSGSPCKSLGYVDSLLSAGETLYVRGGEYTNTTDNFVSANNGTAANRITIQSWQTDTYGAPIFRTYSGAAGSIIQIQNTYWVIDGIHIKPNADGLCDYAINVTASGDYLEIKNCEVVAHLNSDDNYTWSYSAIATSGSYGYFHDNVMVGSGDYSDPDGRSGYTIQMRNGSHYNRVSSNTLSMGGHDNISAFDSSTYNEIIGNDVYDARGYGVNFEQAGSTNYNIVHQNDVSGCDKSTNYQKSGFLNYGSYNIFRYNASHHNSVDFYGGGDMGAYGSDQQRGDYNHWYNNVFYYSDLAGMHLWSNDLTSYNYFVNNVFARSSQNYENDWDRGEVVMHYNAYADDNYFINNYLMGYSSGWTDGGSIINVSDLYPDNMKTVAWMESNYSSAWYDNLKNSTDCPGLDPKWTDPDTDPDAPDLTLQSDSCLIDAGAWLTQANGSGSGSTITVDDAGYFWYSDFAAEWNSKFGTSLTTGDKIIVQTDSGNEVVTITGISSNDISVTPALSAWSDNAPVTLYASFNDHDSILFVGNNPDIGAYEYNGGSTPRTIQGITINGVTIQ